MYNNVKDNDTCGQQKKKEEVVKEKFEKKISAFFLIFNQTYKKCAGVKLLQ